MPDCGRKGCTEPGTAYPVVLFHPVGMPEYTGPPAEMMMKMPVCVTHQAATKVGDIVDDEGWALIVEVFESAGRVLPDRKTLGLAWRRIEVGDALFPSPT